MRLQEKLFWLCVGAALIVLVFSVVPSHYEICEVAEKTKEKECAPYQVVPYAAVKVGRFLDSISPAVTAIFTVVLGISTIGLWKATKRLWEAADATATAQERDTRILQRAYISVDPRGLRLRIDGATLMAHVAMRNAGNLPARKVRWFINIRWSHEGAEEDFPLSEGKGSVVIVPRSEAVRGSDSALSLQDLLAACGSEIQPSRPNQATVFIYVWGAVSYYDGFVEGRTTRFCHRYNWMMRDRYDVDTSHARLHEYGNDSA
jgi:hypothetical protein